MASFNVILTVIDATDDDNGDEYTIEIRPVESEDLGTATIDAAELIADYLTVIASGGTVIDG